MHRDHLTHSHTLRNTHLSRHAMRARRGMSLVLVMGMLSITISLAFALTQWQATTIRLHSNATLNAEARQAAMSGLSVAMRRMHETGWSCDTTYTATLASNQYFTATYTTGDSLLSEGSPENEKWPLRVTLNITGIATDPALATMQAQHEIEAVLELAPRAVTARPTALTGMLDHTVAQYTAAPFTMELPARVRGSVRMQDSFSICDTYPATNTQRAKYLFDLNQMRSQGYPDYRPLTGPILMPTARTSATTRGWLTNELGVNITNTASSAASSWSFPSSLNSYRLYSGGKLYSAQSVNSSSLQNTTLQPNPRTNPLGVYHRQGDLELRNQVSVWGTLVTTGRLRVIGSNVQLEAMSLDSLPDSNAPMQLPAAIINNNLAIGDGASLVIRGLATTWQDFQVENGSYNTYCNFEGRLVCRGFSIGRRNEWNYGSFLWGLIWSGFTGQNGTDYFPVYLWGMGRSPEPNLTISPENATVSYQWLTGSTPLYVPASGDAGLRWSLLRWSHK